MGDCGDQLRSELGEIELSGLLHVRNCDQVLRSEVGQPGYDVGGELLVQIYFGAHVRVVIWQDELNGMIVSVVV